MNSSLKQILTDMILDQETDQQLKEIIEFIDENFQEINFKK